MVMDRILKILILSPSLDTTENISGISSMTSILLKKNTHVVYEHFLVGKKDFQKRNVVWLIYIFLLPFRFFISLFKGNYDIIHFNIGFEPLSLMRDFSLFIIAKIFRRRILLHIHGGRFVLKKATGIIYPSIILLFLRYSSSLVVLSDEEKKSLVQNYQVKEERISVLPNVVLFDEHLDFSKKDFSSILSILYLGRLDMNKGLKEILETLEQLENKKYKFIFRVCGTGPMRDDFLTKCRGIIGNKLKYEGVVCGKRKEEILFKSHVFLLPSYFEGLPMALLESMANYVVPIVTPVGSIPVVVNSGKNGFLVSSVGEMVDYLQKLSDDRCLLRSLSYNAALRVRQDYSVEKYLDKINELYYGNARN